MIPTADIVGLNRQIAIFAYQFGDGITNLCFPTVGSLVGFLMYSKVPYEKWLKCIMPFIGIMFMIASVFSVVAVMINFGPF